MLDGRARAVGVISCQISDQASALLAPTDNELTPACRLVEPEFLPVGVGDRFVVALRHFDKPSRLDSDGLSYHRERNGNIEIGFRLETSDALVPHCVRRRF